MFRHPIEKIMLKLAGSKVNCDYPFATMSPILALIFLAIVGHFTSSFVAILLASKVCLTKHGIQSR